MKILFNGLQFSKYDSGIGMLMKELYSKIISIGEFKTAVILPKDAQESKINTEIIRIPYKNSEGLKRNLYQTFIMGKKYCNDSILLITDSKIPFFMPKNSVTLPIITDLALYEIPNVYKFSRVFLWKLQYKHLVKHVDRVIAISEHTKKDINKYLKIDNEKIDVVYCAADKSIKRIEDKNILQDIKEKYSLPDKYFLFVGSLNPRKNIFRIYQAYKELKKKTDIPHKLVIVGNYGWKLKKELKIMKNDNDVVFTGYIEEKDKSALYTMAEAFVFPSLYEGFGIPILEAQQCGVPVVTSNNSSMPEVAGDGAVYVDPYDVSDIANSIERLLVDEELKRNIINAGYENAKRFSWEESAEKLGEIIKNIKNS